MSQLGSCNCFLSSSSRPLPSPPPAFPYILEKPEVGPQELLPLQEQPHASILDSASCPFSYQKPVLGLRWWSSGYESVCQCRGHRFDPWSWKTPHAVGQLSPGTLEPVLCNKRSHHNERFAHCNKNSPCSPQLEEARVQWWRPSAGKKINVISSTSVELRELQFTTIKFPSLLQNFLSTGSIHQHKIMLSYISSSNKKRKMLPLQPIPSFAPLTV